MCSLDFDLAVSLTLCWQAAPLTSLVRIAPMLLRLTWPLPLLQPLLVLRSLLCQVHEFEFGRCQVNKQHKCLPWINANNCADFRAPFKTPPTLTHSSTAP